MKPFWFTLGALAFMLGAVGVILPVLPTTPFVILAAFAFRKSSPRLRAWLMRSRLFGQMILDWETHGAIPLRVKWTACTMMGAVFLISLYARAPASVLIAQAIGMGLGAAFVVTRPSGPKMPIQNKGL